MRLSQMAGLPRGSAVFTALLVLLLHGAALADQAEFDALWSDTESHLATDVGTIAQAMWGFLCDGCQYTQPSAHNNKCGRALGCSWFPTTRRSYDPNILFNLPDSADEGPFLDMCVLPGRRRVAAARVPSVLMRRM